jgi:CBS domain-containing protein
MKTVAELLRVKPARVVKISPTISVLEAIKVLAAEDIGAAIVMTGDRLAGIFSERDYTRKVILKGRSSDTTRVEEIMTHNVVVVSPRTRARECMALMTEKNIRHLPVVDEGADRHGVDPRHRERHHRRPGLHHRAARALHQRPIATDSGQGMSGMGPRPRPARSCRRARGHNEGASASR